MISVLYFSKQESLNLSMSCLSSELLATNANNEWPSNFEMACKGTKCSWRKNVEKSGCKFVFFFFTGYDKVDEIFVHETLLNQ